MQSKNKTKVVAEAGKQEIFITREFEEPGNWYLRRFQIKTPGKFCDQGDESKV